MSSRIDFTRNNSAFAGWGGWTRTTTAGSKGLSPTVRRRPNGYPLMLSGLDLHINEIEPTPPPHPFAISFIISLPLSRGRVRVGMLHLTQSSFFLSLHRREGDRVGVYINLSVIASNDFERARNRSPSADCKQAHSSAHISNKYQIMKRSAAI